MKIYKVKENMNFSHLLTAAFSTADDSSHSFAILVGQVTARCLVRLRDPLPLAAIVLNADKIKSRVTQSTFLSSLVMYAEAILNFYPEQSEKRLSHSATFLKSYFDCDSPYSFVLNLLAGTKSIDNIRNSSGKSLMCLSPMSLITFATTLNHTFMFSGDYRVGVGGYWRVIQRIVSSIFLVSMFWERGWRAFIAEISILMIFSLFRTIQYQPHLKRNSPLFFLIYMQFKKGIPTPISTNLTCWFCHLRVLNRMYSYKRGSLHTSIQSTNQETLLFLIVRNGQDCYELVSWNTI